MVGEIRDSETAKIAVESALTGHLVFSTLHTNNAGGVIPRLIDLDVNPKTLTSALSMSMA
jgi:type II secretory ATPase GspE/PulE/Tfp pilus assembly ATPase PilB-like protein